MLFPQWHGEWGALTREPSVGFPLGRDAVSKAGSREV